MNRLRKLTEKGMLSYAIQRVVTWYPVRQPIARAISLFRPRPASENKLPATDKMVAELKETGITKMPQFVDAAIVKKIMEHIDGLNLRERYGAKRSFPLDAVPDGVHVGDYEISHVLRSKEIMDLVNSPLLLGVAARYLGCAPTMSSITMWWSFPTTGAPKEAENYHRDVDDWKFVKFFLYLTDVDEKSGPHKYVRRSNKSWKFLFNRRFTDQEVESRFPSEDCLTITGKSGDAFMEDTYGLHKGQPPVSNRRLVLQFEYSLNPIAVYKYQASQIAPGKSLADPYAVRLYLRI